MKTDNHYSYSYKFSFGQFLNLSVGLGLLGSSIFLVTKYNVDNTLIVIVCFLTAVGLTQLILTANYLAKSLDTKVLIDGGKDSFEIIKKGKKQILKLGDIASLDIQEQRSIGLYGFDFDYAKYTFADGRQCIVTNMMTDAYYVPAGLQPKIKRTILPIIWGRTNV